MRAFIWLALRPDQNLYVCEMPNNTLFLDENQLNKLLKSKKDLVELTADYVFNKRFIGKIYSLGKAQ